MSTSVYSQELHLPFNMTTVIEDNHQQEEQVEVEIDQKLITKVASNNNNNGDDNSNINNGDDKNISSKGNINGEIAAMSRKEKRKAMKKMKRKQVRKEIAVKEREEEQARLNDPEEQTRLARLEQEEAERMAKERVQFEERERQFLQALELKKKQEEEEAERLKLLEDSRKEANNENGKEEDEDDGWEYVEEGPAEIIWKGNEIIVKKKKVRVPKKPLDTKKEQEGERPISNPLAPQSEVFEDYRNAQDVLESVAQQVPNFGTEQDKEHCPFHLKTGVCRFGARCSRVHFYPDKACTLLLKNMYHGPGLAWEQDEGLEYTEEEAERSFEDFYEDVHTEFLKYGEIVNFKVCRNGSPHLRGNVYVHYKSLESATLAYQSINGRYFAGKQLTCEFVNLTRWRVAICGEYIKSRLKTCSRGSACNFIHCFRNPGGDYEWADWDKPAPRYWLNSMAALFGCSSDRITDDVSPSSYHSRKSRSRGLASSHRKSFSNEDGVHKRRSLWRHSEDDREDNSLAEEMQRRTNTHQDYLCIKNRETGGTDDKRSSVGIKRSMEKRRESDPTKQDRKSGKDDALSAKDEYIERGVSDRYHDHKNRSSSRQKRKDNKFDLGDNSFAGKHQDTLPKQKGKRFPQETKEADSSNIESHCNSTDSEEDKRHSNSKKNSSRIECEPDLSSSVSDESSLSRVEESKQMNRRNSPRFKRKRSVEEIGSDEVSSECDEDGQYKHIEKSLRSVKHNSETFEGGGRIGREEKRPRKSSRLNHQSATETESESDEAKRHRHSKKHSRQSKKYADSPDSAFEEDRRGRYRNRPKKSRRKSSRSHNESDFADLDRNGERIVVGHHGHRIIKEPSLSKVGRGLKSDDEAIVSSGEAGVELEKACRYAALKKLEEMRKHKTQAACNIEIVEGLKICADENIVADGVNVNRISEESGSIELETSGASVKRRRI